jgi:hypothetical protein
MTGLFTGVSGSIISGMSVQTNGICFGVLFCGIVFTGIGSGRVTPGTAREVAQITPAIIKTTMLNMTKIHFFNSIAVLVNSFLKMIVKKGRINTAFGL